MALDIHAEIDSMMNDMKSIQAEMAMLMTMQPMDPQSEFVEYLLISVIDRVGALQERLVTIVSCFQLFSTFL